MDAGASTKCDIPETAKRSSLLRCPNKQYTEPIWLKFKQIFSGKEFKINVKSEETKNKQDKTSDSFASKFTGKRLLCIILLLSIFCFSSMGCFVMWYTDIYLKQILKTMTIHEGSFMLDAWQKPTIKPLICIHAFNYTNLEEVLSLKAEKLHVADMGPYCYRETLEKINVIFNDNEGTVTYGNKRSHVFEPSHSKGSQDDVLVLPNPALLAVLSKLPSLSFVQALTIRLGLTATKVKPILRVTAHDFFFGYEDQFILLAINVAKILNINVPYEKFGILSFRGTDTGDTITVKTGRNDLDSIDEVTKVNGETKLEAWYDDECNRIDGSDGSFFPRKEIDKQKTLYLFHQDMCRKIPFVYDKEVNFQEGVMGLRYHLSPWMYNTNGTCFCKDDCPPKGTYSLQNCARGIPILMSFPHFLHGDVSLTENISGLKPNATQHDFYIDIQPVLGFTLGLVSRLQVNMQYKTSTLNYFKGLKNDIVLPIVWLEVFADHLPQDIFRVIYHATFTVQNAKLFLRWGTIIITAVTAISIFYNLYRISTEAKVSDPEAVEPRSINLESIKTKPENCYLNSGKGCSSSAVSMKINENKY